MHHRTLLIFSLTFLFVSNVRGPRLLAKSGATAIQGRVINRNTEAPLPNANIVLIGTPRGAATDSNGYYRIEQLSPGKYAIQASMIGFETKIIPHVILEDGETRTIDFSLAPTPVKLDTVIVEAEPLWEKYQTEVSMLGVRRLGGQEIAILPGTFDDPTRAILTRHGASGAGDYNSFLTVRGSSPEQNLVVMDGAVIPNPYRLRLAMGGGLSIFDPKTTQDVHLHLGGFTAEYGNALSSVLEVETRSGNLQRFGAGGSINLTDAGGIIEGPIWKGKASFLLAARRTYLDLLADRLTESNSVYPQFYDLTNKWLLNLNERNKITLSFTSSRERADLLSDLSESVTITEEAKNRHGVFSWKSLLGNRGQLQTLLSYYDDTMALRVYNPGADTIISEYQNLDSRANRLSFQQNVRYRLREQSWLNFGMSMALIESKTDYRSDQQNFYFARNEFPRKIKFETTQKYYAVFFENTSELNESLQTRIGLRYDYATLVEQGELSPRFSVSYKLDEPTTIEGSWGVIYQYPDPITISIRDQPVNFGANLEVVTAEKATHNVIAIKRKLTQEVAASLEFYHIDIDRLLLPEDQETYAPVNSGRGICQGIEFVLEKTPTASSTNSGLISYSFGSSQYHDMESRKWTPFNYDRRHGLTLWYNQRVKKNWQLSLLWRYASGLPYTEVLGVRIRQYTPQDDFSWDYIRSARNAGRFPAYHRLDARLSYLVHSGDRSFSFYLDLINLYNRKNVYNLTWEKEPVSKDDPWSFIAKRRTLYMLPFLPSIGMQFWF
jgi:hypothetical protein